MSFELEAGMGQNGTRCAYIIQRIAPDLSIQQYPRIEYG